jgi:hypothetical protein
MMLHYRPNRLSPRPRRRALALAVGAAGLIALIITGTVLSLLHSFTGTPGAARSSAPTQGRTSQVSATEARARDALAERAMPDTGTGHEFGWPQLSSRTPGTPIELPVPTRVDPLGVASGFPQTPQGALAQLAAIDTAALESGSLPGVRAVISAWAAAGGPTSQTWSGVTAMTSLLESAGLSGAGSPRLRVDVTAAMGLIKGRVGTDFVVACADFSIDITYRGSTTTATVDCQRMLWQQGRWLIGPGREPAQASPVWPDTDAAFDAGFRDLA